MCICHGPSGLEGPKDRLVGGQGTLNTPKPIKTVGSYWPYAPTLYDYLHRAMPFYAPQSLTSDEIYSVIAWLLFKNGIVPEDAVIDARTLSLVQMPNRNGFVPDPGLMYGALTVRQTWRRLWKVLIWSPRVA